VAVAALAAVAAGVLYYSTRAKRPAVSAPAATIARLGPPDIYPNSSITPGAINPEITQANIAETICNPHWSTRSERPPVSYTNRLKREGIAEYNDSDHRMADYEEDHLIPLEIGGSPTDPRNLWPEPYVTSIPDGGAHYKDKVENYLHEQVCSGGVSLAEAQQEIAQDWYRVHVEKVRK